MISRIIIDPIDLLAILMWLDHKVGLKIIIKTVQFEPEWGVHFEPESPVQFEPEWGVQFAPEYPTFALFM